MYFIQVWDNGKLLAGYSSLTTNIRRPQGAFRKVLTLNEHVKCKYSLLLLFVLWIKHIKHKDGMYADTSKTIKRILMAINYPYPNSIPLH